MEPASSPSKIDLEAHIIAQQPQELEDPDSENHLKEPTKALATEVYDKEEEAACNYPCHDHPQTYLISEDHEPDDLILPVPLAHDNSHLHEEDPESLMPLTHDSLPDLTPNPEKIDPEDLQLLNYVKSSTITQDMHPQFSSEIIVNPLDKILITPSRELATISETTLEELGSAEDEIKEAKQEVEGSEKENLTPPAALAPANHDHLHKSPRLIKNLPPLLPITQHQSIAPAPMMIKVGKREQATVRRLSISQVTEAIKATNSASKKANEGGNNNKQQRHNSLPNRSSASAINSKRRISADNSLNQDFNLISPSSRNTTDNEDEHPHNCGRASIESSPCLRHRGYMSSDDARRFPSLHITSRSSTRSEKSSLRGGKIDRVARFAQLQKIWKKDSFVRAIDGEKRPQILQHLFAPLRATANNST